MLRILTFFAMIFLTTTALASPDLFVPIYFTTENGPGKMIGSVQVSQTGYGLLFTPDLHGLTPGLYEFDIHENPSCANHGLAAGGDLDPNRTNKHLGPYNPNGHLGDLPSLYVSSEGTATFPVFAPRILNISDIKNHSFIIQATNKNGETARNKRIACGVIEKSLFDE